ncbi:alpha/beta hydrolase [Spongiivirga citrea]|uniref:Alpha/beta hydrolase n=1 Tax=Spongiivirga citrea TaxID=1481457 RepID=A0A6M0CKS3_9FLAO|nr:alpha/beta hydrolase [Spongiivirga citrea]NER18481.1 alpha/beta hydrolase [Spongiivirga citrea]
MQDLIHVYLMPGMAANPSIFEHIKLPEETFQIHLLSWEIPLKREKLSAYAKRMSEKIEHKDPVLVGVSFGGILVQEISQHINVRKVVVVSSVKHQNELPVRMKLAKQTKAYKLLPTGLINNIDFLAKYAFGEVVTKRVELYEKYLSVRDKYYLDWSIHNIVNWSAPKNVDNMIHIHGDKDGVFPVSNIKDHINVKGGTHVMIINKYKWFNENLPDLILS